MAAVEPQPAGLVVTHTPKMMNEQTREKKVALASKSFTIHLSEHRSLQSID